MAEEKHCEDEVVVGVDAAWARNRCVVMIGEEEVDVELKMRKRWRKCGGRKLEQGSNAAVLWSERRRLPRLRRASLDKLARLTRKRYRYRRKGRLFAMIKIPTY